MKKVNMKRFIYFFIFFLLLTIGLFFVMNTLGSKTIQKSLITSSKNQISYAESMLEGVISEASTYGIQYTADDDVRLYQRQLQELDNYDGQMKKNEIADRITGSILSSQSIELIGVYWKSDSTFISSSHNFLAKIPFETVTKRGWELVDNSLYYFSVYPYIHQPTNPDNIQYVVGVKLKTEYLAGLLEKAVSSESSNAFFFIKNNLLLSNKPVDSKIEAKAKEMIKPDKDRIIQFDYHNGDDDYYVLSKYIKPIDSYLVTYTQVNDIMSPLHRNQQVFMVSICSILLIGLFVIFIFYRNYYRNVQLLGKKFFQVEQGDYGARISENPVNEFFNLFKGFNHMVAKIQSLFSSLKVETELRRDAEIKQLQAQINPHFLYNSLFFIMSMAKASPDSVIQMSKHLAEYYRYLTRLDSMEATLSSELKLADHYLSIMALSKQIQYDIDLPDELGGYPIMPLIIQPVVENAIQHGIEERQGAYRVKIEVKILHPGALIIISNDGRGLNPDDMEELAQRIASHTPPASHKGIGLWNINKRLINAYGELSSLRFFINDWGGLSVMTFIDLGMEGEATNAAANR